jgi:hypothetical protein
MDGLSRAHYRDLRAMGAVVCGGLMGFSMRSGPDEVDRANEEHGSTRRGAIVGAIAADVSGTAI